MRPELPTAPTAAASRRAASTNPSTPSGTTARTCAAKSSPRPTTVER